MKRSAKVVTGLVTLLIFASANASSQSHYAAAERFYNTTKVADVNALTSQMVSAMVARSPELIPHKSVLLNFMREIVTSKEYRDLKIRSYMAHLSESQLIELSRIFSSDAYQKFRAHQAEMLKESNNGLQQLLRSRQGELARRIEENARKNAQ